MPPPRNLANAASFETSGFAVSAAAEVLSPAERTLRDLLRREFTHVVPDLGDITVAPDREPPAAPTTPEPPAAPTTPTVTRVPIDFVYVQPGDLITAGFVNGLIDILHLLDLRLMALEAAEAAPNR